MYLFISEMIPQIRRKFLIRESLGEINNTGWAFNWIPTPELNGSYTWCWLIPEFEKK